ncbi:AzlD domain-containing protein [Natranaerofaba carboxydovora]|uniref:AzlD domain-containing protein n=1 Tax=Natranaerofaba carboxydovora TaxID=2742683 RepID=UPI001F12D253|nr:AzlD domain-containing protein [Natranaerofaba carboxydovora]UMZ74528.1 Branched-chain amino acid transport protein (AzlD) [Natranaerofaba carboxydovora]
MDHKVLLILIGMAVVTYIPRFLPLALFSRLEIPDIVIRWLNYVPVAILAALLAPGVMMEESELFISFDNPFLLAAVPTFLTAIKTKNMMLTVFTGMIFVIGIRNIF